MSESGGRRREDDRLPHLRDSELAAFLDGGLSDSERHRVEAHIDICDACRAELVDIGRAVARPGKRAKVATVPLSRRWWIPAAAAAGIVAILMVPRLATRAPATDGQTRAARVVDGEGQRRIDPISPADDVTVAASQMTFAWHAVAAADVYRISLLTATGDSLWAKETTDTTATVPATVSLSPGRAYFWHVDAVANGIVAKTPARRVQVSR
jgi:hypothetical protein